MQTVEVEADFSRLVRVPHNCAECWQLYHVPLPETYVGALVVAGEAAVKIAQWQHLEP